MQVSTTPEQSGVAAFSFLKAAGWALREGERFGKRAAGVFVAIVLFLTAGIVGSVRADEAERAARTSSRK